MHIGVRLAVLAVVLMLAGPGAQAAPEQASPALPGTTGITNEQEEYLREKYGLETPSPRQPQLGGDWGNSLKVRK